MTATKTKIISLEMFRAGHALSFHCQPYLEELFRRACNPAVPLTIVVGAGVSMNAGLRSWSELVGQMSLKIESEKFRKIVNEDRADLMRKVEMILQLINGGGPQHAEAQIIRESLYQHGMTLVPGQLALSIAKLASLRRNNVRLITTNFDTLLEAALRCYVDADDVRSYGLEDCREWAADTAGGGPVGVMHVHGMVPLKGESKEPVILAESQYFQHGASVRRIISDSLKDACALFVGLSMSDPNMIGPLYDMKKRHSRATRRFALTVPEHAPGAYSEQESVEYAMEAAKFMERKLKLSTILLKSYSQLNQVLADLSLAFVEPVGYLSEPPESPSSLIYGTRLAKALDRCYSAAGCTKQDRVPAGNRAIALHDRLYEALHSDQGPVGVISEIARASYGYEFRRSTEKLSLFLWLRSRGRRQAPARYTLNLLGTSAYIHREGWSLKSEIEIVRSTKMTAAKAVFYGAPLAEDLEDLGGSPTWRGLIALPIVLDSIRSSRYIGATPADILTVGAITLNSTHRVAPEDLSTGARISIMALFDDEQMKLVRESILYAASVVLTPRA